MKVALLTCEELDQYITDEHFLEKALEKEGFSYKWVNWNDKSVNWNDFDSAIIRTTWDYMKHKSDFLTQLKKIEDSSCKLYNSLSIVEWNSNKKYLSSLEKEGVSIIPTKWFVNCSYQDLEACFVDFDSQKIVIKPNVGAGSFKTFLIHNDKKMMENALEELKGIEVMVQPYLDMVAEEGEYSLHYFNKSLSHVILKTPKSGDFRSQEEFGSHIRKVEVTEELKTFANKVLSKINENLLYARVDVIRNKEELNLIELELIEPSLYFRFHEPAADLLVQAFKDLSN